MDEKHKAIQKKHELEQHEVKQVLEFLTRYGKLIGAGLIVACAVVLVSRGIAYKKAQKISEAEQMLSSAQTPEQIEEVINNYKSTPTAPAALLHLARTHFNNGDTAAARANYERFVKDYKKHSLKPQADFGLAYCTEAEGNFDAAAKQLKEFIEKNANSYLIPSATIAMARCIEQTGDLKAARIILEDFLAANPDSQWVNTAENALTQLDK